jgi:hypothetical protein
MNTEIENKTDHQNTVEQNQNGAAELTAHDQPVATPATSVLLNVDESGSPTTNPSIQPSINPCPDPIQESIDPAETGAPAIPPSIQESSHPFADSIHQSFHPALDASDSASHPISSLEPETDGKPPRPVSGITALQATITLNRAQGRPSKVSQLPPELIAFVNEQLLRRVPQDIIAQELEERGHPGFSKSNISNWKLGPFKKWAEAQQTLDQQNRQRELALDYARTHGTSLLETLEEIHAQNLYETAVAINPSRLVKKFQETPELFLKLNREISSFVKICREKKPGAVSVARKQESPASHGWEREKNGGLTLEARDNVRASLGIFPPPPEPNADATKTAPVTEKEP